MSSFQIALLHDGFGFSSLASFSVGSSIFYFSYDRISSLLDVVNVSVMDVSTIESLVSASMKDLSFLVNIVGDSADFVVYMYDGSHYFLVGNLEYKVGAITDSSLSLIVNFSKMNGDVIHSFEIFFPVAKIH